MTKHIKLQKNYSLNQNGYQLKLPLNIESIIPEDDSVRLLSQFVEAMDLTDLYSTYERINSVSPRTLLKIVLYSYMNGDFSSRSMELNCKRDINFMFLLEGAPAPDHATFARFRSIHFAPCSKRILAEMSNTLLDLGEISGETIFIDGTKIEASANKYTFVWKKAVTKNQAKLLIKLADFVAECERLYDIKIVYGNTIKIKHVKRLRKKLYALKERENVVFVHGIGKSKTPLQKSIETLEDYLCRLKKYNQQAHICGERNSYSKTDHDATFMRMKADAGYESEENYLFLESNGQLSYIKPANYEISKTRRYKNDIGKIENMEYDPESDSYTCRNGQKIVVDHIKHEKSKTGYVSEKTIYKCKNCSGCPYKSECIKGNNCKTPMEERSKTLHVSKAFLKHREADLERILSEEGILFRTNRSIQAEGSFGDMKQDMQFRRYLSKGTSNVLAESTLLAMAKNMNKLHNKIQNGKTGTHLFPVKSA
jgi:transposase